MRLAFHFDADQWGDFYGWPIQELFFRLLLNTDLSTAHLMISTGDLLVYQYIGNPTTRQNIVHALLGEDLPTWKGLKVHEFTSSITTRNIYVISVEGISPLLRDYMHAALLEHPSYLGVAEVYPANGIHWVLYDQSLIATYRVFARSLRLFFSMGDEENRDEGLFDHWSQFGFDEVLWEDRGVAETILDKYQTFDHAKREVTLASFLSERVASQAGEVLIRLNDAHPALVTFLYSAIMAFKRVETEEDLAHIAVSCRRFMEALANTLYPARTELVDGHEVGRTNHKNRLWAYVAEQMQGSSPQEITQKVKALGRRIDTIYAKTNKGVHDILESVEAERLLVDLLLLNNDLLALAPPPRRANLAPYETEVNNFIREIAATVSDSDRPEAPRVAQPLAEERLQIRRETDFLTNERVVLCSALVIDVRGYQLVNGPSNSYESALNSIMAGLVRANYRLDVVVWGHFGATVATFPAYYFFVYPMRSHGYARVLDHLLKSPGLEEVGSSTLPLEAKPILKWSANDGLIRLWSDRSIPDFSKYGQSPAFARALYYTSMARERIVTSETRTVGKTTFTFTNRRCTIEWLDT